MGVLKIQQTLQGGRKFGGPRKMCPELDRSIHDLANRYPGRSNEMPPKFWGDLKIGRKLDQSNGVAKRDCIQQPSQIWERWKPKAELRWGLSRIGQAYFLPLKNELKHPEPSWLFSTGQKWIVLKPKMDAADRTIRSPGFLWVPEIGSHAVIGPAQFYATPAVI